MTVFISHSKKDKEFKGFFDKVFAGTHARRICVEFEDYELPPWRPIRNWIQQSRALFLLLSPKIIESRYTQNWISYEVGIASGVSPYKDIWVFERIDEPVDFPVPYLNHYMIVDIEDKNHSRYVKEIVSFYQPFLLNPPRPHGIIVECPVETCGAVFELHTRIQSFKCPSCRQPLELEESP